MLNQIIVESMAKETQKMNQLEAVKFNLGRINTKDIEQNLEVDLNKIARQREEQDNRFDALVKTVLKDIGTLENEKVSNVKKALEFAFSEFKVVLGSLEATRLEIVSNVKQGFNELKSRSSDVSTSACLHLDTLKKSIETGFRSYESITSDMLQTLKVEVETQFNKFDSIKDKLKTDVADSIHETKEIKAVLSGMLEEHIAGQRDQKAKLLKQIEDIHTAELSSVQYIIKTLSEKMDGKVDSLSTMESQHQNELNAWRTGLNHSTNQLSATTQAKLSSAILNSMDTQVNEIQEVKQQLKLKLDKRFSSLIGEQITNLDDNTKAIENTMQKGQESTNRAEFTVQSQVHDLVDSISATTLGLGKHAKQYVDHEKDLKNTEDNIVTQIQTIKRNIEKNKQVVENQNNCFQPRIEVIGEGGKRLRTGDDFRNEVENFKKTKL